MLWAGVGASAMLLSEYFNSFSSKLFSLSMCLLHIYVIMGGMCSINVIAVYVILCVVVLLCLTELDGLGK